MWEEDPNKIQLEEHDPCTVDLPQVDRKLYEIRGEVDRLADVATSVSRLAADPNIDLNHPGFYWLVASKLREISEKLDNPGWEINF